MREDKYIRQQKGFPTIKPLIAVKIRPNDPCPCGSGKKAKHCCGTETRHYRV